MHSLKIPLLIGLFFLVSSCANYKLNYDREAKNWEQQQPDPDLRISHTMFLVGDAGGVGTGQEGPALQLLEKKLKAAGKQSSVLFLARNQSRDEFLSFRGKLGKPNTYTKGYDLIIKVVDT